MAASKKSKVNVNMYDSSLVFAAASAAYRLLGAQYVKAGEFKQDQDGNMLPVQGNKDKIVELINNQEEIQDIDMESGEQLKKHYQGLMFKILAGKVLNEFDMKALALANAEQISDRDFGVIAYLPAGFERARRQQSISDRILECNNSYIAGIGSKIVTTGEVVKINYSQQWATYYVTMITDDNYSVFFSIKKNLTVGSKVKIAGTVRSHREQYQTQLNFVKII